MRSFFDELTTVAVIDERKRSELATESRKRGEGTNCFSGTKYVF